MFSYFLFILSKSWVCTHDQEFAGFYKNRKKQMAAPNPDYFNDEGIYDPPRAAMRMTIDYSYLEDDADYELKCKTEGQQIVWGNTQYTCTSADLMTSTKKAVITDTMNNLIEYFAKSLKVTPRQDPITLQTSYGSSQTVTLPSGEIENSDMHLIIVPRPFGNLVTLASAVGIQTDDTEGRPIQGIVFINLATLPSKAQTSEEFPNEFFATCFHEACHALGITIERVDEWIDRKTGVPYATPPTIEATSGSKTFTFLVTPEAHKLAVKRFGTETFKIGENIFSSGIELEDGGGTGTKGSHPEARVYLGEAMIGYSVTNSVISELSFALLADTGFYDVNYTMTKGFQWGNSFAFNYGHYNSGFPTDAPQQIFYQNHLCNVQDEVKCTFDYKAVGLCMASPFDCSKPQEEEQEDHEKFCSYQEFYNPNGYTIRGNVSVFDYIMFVSPYSNKDCLNPDTFTPDEDDEEAGLTSRCM